MTAAILAEGDWSVHSSSALGYGTLFFVLGVLGTGYFQLWLVNSRLLVGPDRFGYRDALGHDHVWHAAQVGTIIDVSIVFNRSSPPRRVIYFLGIDGKKLLEINPASWGKAAIDRLTDAAGKPVQIHSAPVAAAEFNREFPRAMAWAGTHTMLLGVTIGLGIIVLVAVGLIAMTSLHL